MKSSLSSRFRYAIDAVLLEDVVADRDLREQVGLPPVHELPMAIEQIEELRLKRGAGAVGVEIGEKRVLGVFADEGGVQARGQPFGECGLASANRPVDRDVVEVQAAEKYIRIFMSPCVRALRARLRLAAGCASAPPRGRRPSRCHSRQRCPGSCISKTSGSCGTPLRRGPAAPADEDDRQERRWCLRPRRRRRIVIRLLRDPEARVRRRAALAAGRVGLPEALPDLLSVLRSDTDPEVRQMAAFALGLIGDKQPPRSRRCAWRSSIRRRSSRAAPLKRWASSATRRPPRTSASSSRTISAPLQHSVPMKAAIPWIRPRRRSGSASTRWRGSRRTTRLRPPC